MPVVPILGTLGDVFVPEEVFFLLPGMLRVCFVPVVPILGTLGAVFVTTLYEVTGVYRFCAGAIGSFVPPAGVQGNGCASAQGTYCRIQGI